jgi:hypothetical protein
MRGGLGQTESMVHRLPFLLWGILATHACARHGSAREIERSGVVRGDGAPPPAKTTNPQSEGGERPPTLSADRIAALAFSGLGEQPGWKTQAKQGPPGSGLWLALAQRVLPHASEGRDPETTLEAWPETRIALIQEVDGILKDLVAGQVSSDVVPCQADESAMSRTFETEIDETFTDIVPGQAFLPLRIGCTLDWPAAESFEEHLLLSTNTGSGFAEVLNVLTEHTDYDHLTNKGTGRRFVAIPHPAKNGDRTQLCLEAVLNENAESAQRTQAIARVPRRSQCYEWDGTRFRRL